MEVNLKTRNLRKKMFNQNSLRLELYFRPLKQIERSFNVSSIFSLKIPEKIIYDWLFPINKAILMKKNKTLTFYLCFIMGERDILWMF